MCIEGIVIGVLLFAALVTVLIGKLIAINDYAASHQLEEAAALGIGAADPSANVFSVVGDTTPNSIFVDADVIYDQDSDLEALVSQDDLWLPPEYYVTDYDGCIVKVSHDAYLLACWVRGRQRAGV